MIAGRQEEGHVPAEEEENPDLPSSWCRFAGVRAASLSSPVEAVPPGLDLVEEARRGVRATLRRGPSSLHREDTRSLRNFGRRSPESGRAHPIPGPSRRNSLSRQPCTERTWRRPFKSCPISVARTNP